MPFRFSAAPARPAAVAVAAALALVLAACQDPSGVGLGLLGEDGGTPTGTVIAADSVRLRTDELPFTGGYGDGSSGVRAQTRVLVGHVVDPVVGTADAQAYFDLRPPSTIPGDYREHDITSVTLRLRRDYVYGDSTATLTVRLHPISADWDPLSLKPDTALAVGALIAEYEVSAADTLVQLRLPDAWVAANQDVLQDEDFVSEFHGFRLSVADGGAGTPGAVFGFRTVSPTTFPSIMRVVTPEETVDYPVSETFTALEWSDPPPPPTDRIILRTADPGLLSFTFSLDDVDSLAVAGGAIRLNIDRTLIENDGVFVRHLPPGASLYGIADTEDSTRVFITSATIDEDEDEEVLTFASSALTALLQQALFGDPAFVRYEVALSVSPLGVGFLPIVTGPAPATPAQDRRPRVTLTGIPTPR